MSFNLKQLTKVNNRNKYLITGWIRENQQQWKLHNIADLIKAQCILYYIMFEYFAERGEVIDVISLFQNKDTVTRSRRRDNYEYSFDNGSAFGHVNLNEYKFNMIWTFYVNRLQLSNQNTWGNMFIGITNMKNTHLNKNIFATELKYCKKWNSHGISASGHKYTMTKNYHIKETTGIQFKEGDTVTMVFKRKDKTLEFKKNNIKIATLMNIILNEDEMNMVIAIRGCIEYFKHASITLLNFATFK